VLETELDTFIANYTDHRNDIHAHRAGNMIERAHRAVVLGLIRHVGLTSPLVDAGLSVRCRPVLEAATTASRHAAPYLAAEPDKVEKPAKPSQAMRHQA
jgi:hypothetical protein